MTLRLLWLALPGLCAAGCAAPTVKLATAEPIKMDINVRLDVYQHNAPAAKAPAAAAPAKPESPSTPCCRATHCGSHANRS